MKKRILCLLFAALLLLTACAKAPTWQEQYDLGVRYLSEGNYQEAVIAFTAAVEIDDRQPAAYAGLAEAYLQSGDPDKAREILQQGVGKTGDAGLQQRLEELAEQQAWIDEADQSATAYGATDFTSRLNYYTFESLTQEEQQFIADFATAVIAGDTDAIHSFVAEPVSIDKSYTVWSDYKIFIFTYSTGLNVDNRTAGENVITIELRPENGMGYYCNVSLAFRTGDKEKRVAMVSCPCENWQWNGTFDELDHWSYMFNDGSEVTGKGVIEGTMQAGVRHGTFTAEYQSVHTSSMLPDENLNVTLYDEMVYQNGVWTDYKEYENGQLANEWDDEDRQQYTDDIWGIGGTYSRDEDRYW